MRQKGTREELDALLECAWEGQHKRQKWAESHPLMPNKHKSNSPAGESSSFWDGVFRPIPARLLAVAGIIGGVIIGDLHSPLWLMVVTFMVFLGCAASWQWIEHHRRREVVFWIFIVLYSTFAVFGTLKLREFSPEEKLLQQISLGQRYGTEALSQQFTIGYVMFSPSYSNQIVFHKGRSDIKNYDFDWSKVKYLPGASDGFFRVQMPDMRPKKGGTGNLTINGFELTGPKQVGWNMVYNSNSDAKSVLEVLDVDQDGIVFVIGLIPNS